MSEAPRKLIVDLSKPVGEQETFVDLTADEIAEIAQMAIEDAAMQEEKAAAAEALAELKTSARAKLVAGEPLSAEEAATLVI
tara:strand:+ start:1099 stop:1344 length:246 start_codon:yes stop_codon:yes gene_type:complete